MLEHFGSAANRIEFTGPLSSNNVKMQLGKCSIVVIPSLWENYPTVVLEAMAAGCAVAASKRGGIPEMIENFKTGILFNPIKIDSIVASVQYLIDHSQKRIEMAFAGREMIKHRNAEESILLTEKVYSSVVNKNNS
jgi:glycosyltransferase involved in cell wall biosynthesis